MASKQKKNEFIERCVCKEEANASVEAKGLIKKPKPHHKNPKWVAILGTRPNCSILGDRKNYTHKLVFEVKIGTIEWLKAFETKKSNEPNSFEIPVDKIVEFNAKVIKVTVEDNSKTLQKRKKK